MEVDEVELSASLQVQISAPVHTQRKEVKFGNIGVGVFRGNIINQKVDVLVNSSSTSLDLSKGKASNALLQAAGNSIQNECNANYPNGISQNDVAVTGPGNLSFKNIYHVALPKYTGATEEKVLENLVKQCLEKASNQRATSIAFPAFGTGFLNYPAQKVAQITFDCVANFSRQNPQSSLKMVDIVIYLAQTFQTFLSEARQRSKLPRPAAQATQPSTAKQQLTYNVGRVKIDLVEGQLATTKADVIVSSGPKSLQLKNGGLSQSLLEEAGEELQNDCNKKYPNGIEFGDIAVSSGFDLKCHYVYHGALPDWGTANTDPLKILKDFVQDCLDLASKHPTTSIAFPTLGTGSLKFPAKDAANAMIEVINKFVKGNPATKLRHVIIVVYSHDKNKKDTKSAFEAALKKIATQGQVAQKQQPPSAVVRRQISTANYGEVTVNLIAGNMIDEKADVIVCSTSPDLKLKTATGLSTALLNVAGDGIQQELDNAYTNGINVGDIAEVSGHKLKCKKVYFGTLLSWYSKKTTLSPEDALKKFVKDFLTKANNDGHKSLALPALGTVYMKFPPDDVASIIIQLIKEFSTNTRSINLTTITIVLFEQGKDFNLIEKAFMNELSGTTPVKPQLPTSLPKQKVPPRGTKKYFEYKYKEVLYSPSYWTAYTNKHSLKNWNLQQKGTPRQLVNIDKTTSTYKSIESAFRRTIGLQGVDIVSITRLENTELYMRYAEECQRLFRKAAIEGEFKRLENVTGSSGPVKTMRVLDSSMIQCLHPEINEYFFFHGTKQEGLAAIQFQGLDPRVGSSLGRIGRGVYGAEISAKSHQYVGQLNSGEHPMFLIRMCLGDIYTTSRQQTFTRPPCRICGSGVCVTHPELFDSVVADGGAFSDREFVVYDIHQTYPEYIILYR